MDNNQEQSDFEGARDKCIYRLHTFVNQDGFKIEEHVPVDDKEAPHQFYGFYLINTELGPVDRYFKFTEQSTIDECFGNFRSLAEEDAKVLAAEMKRQHEAQQQQAAINNQVEVPTEPDAQLLDEHGSLLS